MQVDHSILPNVDRIEQILDDGVGWGFLPCELVDLVDELDELGEGDATGLLNVELHRKHNKASVL